MDKLISILRLMAGLLILVHSQLAGAADSYRWLHVTIDTPWAIFIFLLPMVLIPIIIMAILYWRFSGNTQSHSREENSKQDADKKL